VSAYTRQRKQGHKEEEELEEIDENNEEWRE